MVFTGRLDEFVLHSLAGLETIVEEVLVEEVLERDGVGSCSGLWCSGTHLVELGPVEARIVGLVGS